MKYYLAVDIGASGGRHMIGSAYGGKMTVREIYRFHNGMTRREGHLCWDTKYLFSEIIEGMKRCFQAGYVPESMGIDTWAVDFVLLDGKRQRLGPAVGYRDQRTNGMTAHVYKKISEEALYERTGIQKQVFNTIYQLTALKRQQPGLLESAKTLLMLPDYFHFLLTGKMGTEYTNGTTTQLINAHTGVWDTELIKLLGFPTKIFQNIYRPGTVLGPLSEHIRREVGFNCKVVLPPTHDTASAVAAVPFKQNTGLYISSGTWSLMGTEIDAPICTESARRKNLTNEGGYDGKFRLLKNIMGLWMIQSVRHEFADRYSFGELCDMAKQYEDFPSRVDVNDNSFLAPDSMVTAIRQMCARTGQPVPEGVGQLASVVYHSLADSYGAAAGEIEDVSGQKYDTIHIIGGGANADYLNRLTAKACHRTVIAGPSEATAIGNLAVQMISDSVFENIQEARACIGRSFPVKIFE